MTTRRKLYKLEMQTPSDPADLYRDLVRLLGQVDGTLFPPRFAGDSGRYCSETLSQRDYMRDGVTFTTENQDDTTAQTGWKRSERIRSAMESAGWITIGSSAKVRLTMAGDCLGRSLVGQASLNDIVPRAIFELLKRAKPDRSSGWVCETTLFNVDSSNSDDYQQCSEVMLPLLQFGFVEVASSTIARLFYRPLVDSLPDPIDVTTGEYNSDLSQVYTDSFCMAIRQRCNRDVGSELCVPLGAS